jgi:hypothetical protein
MRELRNNVPELIVVQRNDVFPAVTGQTTDSKRELDSFPELSSFISDRYALVKRIEDFEVYQLSAERGEPPKPVVSESPT